MSDVLRLEIDALFSAFLPAHVASRFSELLAMKPARWSKIDPWHIWDRIPTDPRIVKWAEPIASIPRSHPFASQADGMVTVLRCGHDHPSLERQRLSEAVAGRSPVLEGFISVVPGKLGIAINHDGQACVLRNRQPQ